MHRLDALWWEAVGPPESADDEREGFVNLGGYSLAAARLIGTIREEFGVDLPLVLLLRDNLSLAGVRAFVDAQGSGSSEPASPPAAAVVSDAGSSQLAPGQRRIWLLSKLYPAAAAYNVVASVRFSGSLSLDALRAALAHVVDRHDALRARVVETADLEPSLRYETGVAPELVVHETAACGLEPAAVDAFIRKVAGQVIPMDQPPLLRTELLRTADGAEACLVLSIHHLVSDLRTLDLVLADLAEAYNALVGGRPAAFEPAPSFAAYAGEQAALAGGSAWKSDLGYWLDLLRDPPEPALPFQPVAPPTPSFEGEDHNVGLGPERTELVDAFVRGYGVTPAALFLSCVAAVQAAWAGTDQTIVGMPASRRGTASEQNLAGFLLETLPILVDVGAQPDLAGLLRHAQDRMVAAITHAAPTFDAVVEGLGPRPRTTVSPLFQVWFNDLTGGAPLPAFAGVSAQLLPIEGFAALFEVNVYLHRDADGYRLQLVRAVDRVRADVAAELLDQCVRVLDQILTDAMVSPARLDLTTDQAREHREHRSAGHDPIPRLVRVTGEPQPVAIRTPHGEVSRSELADLVDNLAGRLAAAGVNAGSVVAIRAQRAGGLPVALLAAWQAGTVAALVDDRLPELRLADLHARLRPAAVLTVDPGRAAAVGVAPGVPEPRVLPDVGHVLFTSGTGGEPSAVVIGRGALETAMGWYQQAFRPGPADRVALLAGLGHDPVLRDLLVPLWFGGTLTVPPQEAFTDPVRLLGFLADQQVTLLHATPPMLELLLAVRSARPLSSVRLVVSGGAPLTAGLVRRLRTLLPAATVVNGYGTTETPQLAACHIVLDEDAGWPDEAVLPLGRGVPGTVLDVCLPGGEPAGIGQLGELVATGGVAAGYLDSVDSDGWFGADPDGRRTFRTGDLGRLDPQGLVHFAGRRDRRLTIDGFRLEPAELERAALRLPGVAQALAGLVATAAGPTLTLNVVPEPGAALEPDAMRTQLRARLPRYAVPGAIVVLPELATNANLKTLLTAADSGPAAVRPARAARGRGDETVRWLEALLREVLGRWIAPEENFFEAGLTSLNLLRLHGRLAAELADPPPPTALFAHPNLRALARFLSGGAPAGQRRRRSSVDLDRVSQEAQLRRAARRGRQAGEG